MSWKLRHTGSPQAISNLSPQQIAEGLAEGDYEPGDEVMGPSDNRWIPMEEHPHFLETVEAYNDSLDAEVIDGSEDHIDMNPLIDVCLVLLVIFIMAQSMAILDKVIEAPKVPKKEANQRALKVIDLSKKNDTMILLEAMGEENKEAVIKVEGQTVALNDLPNRLKSMVFNNPQKNMLVVKHQGINHGTMVAICDAAAQANIREVKVGASPKQAAAGAAPKKQ
jgi:biopolymer transport protein ExbD